MFFRGVMTPSLMPARVGSIFIECVVVMVIVLVVRVCEFVATESIFVCPGFLWTVFFVSGRFETRDGHRHDDPWSWCVAHCAHPPSSGWQ